MTDTQRISRREALKTLGVSGGILLGSQFVDLSQIANAQIPDAEVGISGTVDFADGPSIAGISVFAIPHNEDLDVLVTQTDSNGDYGFAESDLYSGDNLYHVITRYNDNGDLYAANENYPFIHATGTIRDSIVTISDSNVNTSTQLEAGVEFESNFSWSKIGFRITQDTSGFTIAYIRNLDDGGSSVATEDISSLTAGDIFTINETIEANTTYEVVIDAGGSSYTAGAYDNPSFPITSPDGDLSVTDGRVDGGSANNAWNIREIGDIGFN